MSDEQAPVAEPAPKKKPGRPPKAKLEPKPVTFAVTDAVWPDEGAGAPLERPDPEAVRTIQRHRRAVVDLEGLDDSRRFYALSVIDAILADLKDG